MKRENETGASSKRNGGAVGGFVKCKARIEWRNLPWPARHRRPACENEERNQSAAAAAAIMARRHGEEPL